MGDAVALTVAEFSSDYPDVVAHLVIWPFYYLIVAVGTFIGMMKAEEKIRWYENYFDPIIRYVVGICSLCLVSVLTSTCLFNFNYKYLPDENGIIKEEGLELSEFKSIYPNVSAALFAVPFCPVILPLL